MFWAHAGIGILIDIILVGVPVWIIYTKMMISPSKKRVLVILALTFLWLLLVQSGSVVCIFSITQFS